jgi:hypothetical protein
MLEEKAHSPSKGLSYYAARKKLAFLVLMGFKKRQD